MQNARVGFGRTVSSGLGRLAVRGAAGLAVLMALWSGVTPIRAAEPGERIGAADIIVRNVFGDNLDKRIARGDPILFQQRISTGVESAARIVFIDDSDLRLGERAEILLDELVCNPETSIFSGTIELVRGLMRVRARPGGLDVTVSTRAAAIGIRGTEFDVLATSRATEIAVYEGSIEVTSPTGSVRVGAGEVVRVTAATAPVVGTAPTAALVAAAARLDSLLPDDTGPASEPPTERTEAEPAEPPPAAETRLAQAPLEDAGAEYLAAIAGKDRENLLLMELLLGRLVIEMRPDLAPNHVARIKELVREGFYDGLVFHNVVDGFAAETGDPDATGFGGSGQQLEAELSGQPFVRGTVGMKHQLGRLNTADSQFFIILGRAAHLDGRYTVWGQVIYGIEFTDLLVRGQPPAEPDRIVTLRIAADVEFEQIVRR